MDGASAGQPLDAAQPVRPTRNGRRRLELEPPPRPRKVAALVGGEVVRVLVHAVDETSARRSAAEKPMRASISDEAVVSFIEVSEAGQRH